MTSIKNLKVTLALALLASCSFGTSAIRAMDAGAAAVIAASVPETIGTLIKKDSVDTARNLWGATKASAKAIWGVLPACTAKVTREVAIITSRLPETPIISTALFAAFGYCVWKICPKKWEAEKKIRAVAGAFAGAATLVAAACYFSK